MVMSSHVDGQAMGFIGRADVADISQRGPVTPDHVIRTKPTPLVGRDVDGFVAAYRRYFDDHSRPGAARRRAPTPRPRPPGHPRPELGLCCAGRTPSGRGRRGGRLPPHDEGDPRRHRPRRLPAGHHRRPVRRGVLGPRAGQAPPPAGTAAVRGRDRPGHRRRQRHRAGLRHRPPGRRGGGGRHRRQPGHLRRLPRHPGVARRRGRHHRRGRGRRGGGGDGQALRRARHARPQRRRLPPRRRHRRPRPRHVARHDGGQRRRQRLPPPPRPPPPAAGADGADGWW